MRHDSDVPIKANCVLFTVTPMVSQFGLWNEGAPKLILETSLISWQTRKHQKALIGKGGVGWNRNCFGKDKKGKDRRHKGENTRTWQTFLDRSKIWTPAAAAVEKKDCKTGRAHGVIHHERTKHLVLKYGTSVFDVHQQPKPQGGEITVLNKMS